MIGTEYYTEGERKNLNCCDCTFWHGRCSKGKLVARALDPACDLFERRTANFEGVTASKTVKPRTPLRKFGRQECQGCNYKGSTYCYRQCPYNLWKRQDDW